MYLRKVVMLNLFASLTMSQELATGTYFLRLITANQTFTQKVTYVK